MAGMTTGNGAYGYHGMDDEDMYDMTYYAAGPSGSSGGHFDERDLIDEMIEEIGIYHCFFALRNGDSLSSS